MYINGVNAKNNRGIGIGCAVISTAAEDNTGGAFGRGRVTKKYGRAVIDHE